MTGLLKVGSVYSIKERAKSSLGVSLLNIESVTVVKQDKHSYPIVKVHKYKANHHKVLITDYYYQNSHLDAHTDSMGMVDMTNFSFSITNVALEEEIAKERISNFGSDYGVKPVNMDEEIFLYL